jgi:uncharacterized protein (DUF488 family)
MNDFIAILQSFDIKILVDIRSMPGSRRFPQFDKENLETVLPESGIRYIYMKDLGGRRKVRKDSKNNRWKNASFRGYADYMETDNFENAVTELENIALQAPTAYMCAESVWWRCHRSLISDYLKAKGWKVLHIMNIGKIQEHTYTSPAKVINNHVSYTD